MVKIFLILLILMIAYPILAKSTCTKSSNFRDLMKISKEIQKDIKPKIKLNNKN